jgi:hypothetical protein
MVNARDRRASGTAAAARRATEQLIDEIVSQSFPASDPPAWGAVAARLQALEDSASESRPPWPPRP